MNRVGRGVLVGRRVGRRVLVDKRVGRRMLFKWRRLVKRLNGLETTERECIKEYKNIYWLKHDPQVTLL